VSVRACVGAVIGVLAALPAAAQDPALLRQAEREYETLSRAEPPRSTGCGPALGLARRTQEQLLDATPVLIEARFITEGGYVLFSAAVNRVSGIELRELENSLNAEATASIGSALRGALTLPRDTVTERYRIRVDAGTGAQVRVAPAVFCRAEPANRTSVSRALGRAMGQEMNRQRLRLRGTVTVAALIAADGKVERAELVASTRNVGYDRAITEALQRARFLPALIDGVGVPTWIEQPIVLP
jgi:TonB family protein